MQALAVEPLSGWQVAGAAQSASPAQRRWQVASSAVAPTQMVVASQSSGAHAWPSVDAGMHTELAPKCAHTEPAAHEQLLAKRELRRARWTAAHAC